MDEIRIEGLEVYAYHGVYRDENENGQQFRLNVTLYADTGMAAKEDELELSTDYGAVCRFLDERMKNHTYKLLETVAEELAREVLLSFPLVREIDLEVCKPQAPIGLPFKDVSVKIHRGWHQVYLSIGSNMGDREEILKQGVEALKEDTNIRALKESTLIETSPYGGVEQEDFLNGALFMETLYGPEELLQLLHRIEADAGRERLVHWGPRTLDLDILFYDKLIYESEDLVIPHVDLENRSFVLDPMCELAPNFRHPIYQKTMLQLQRQLQERQ